jgi:catechol 2,3-dioxygenase-like lactoylglutathione lyase family enzyme
VAVEVKNVRWVGIRTDRYDEMVAFLRDVLGLRTRFEEPTTVELETSEGDQVQVMAPGDPYYEFFGAHARGPVPLFEVDDVHAARRELEAAGVEIIGATERDSSWEWIHVRAPDGNLYELASRLPTQPS